MHRTLARPPLALMVLVAALAMTGCLAPSPKRTPTAQRSPAVSQTPVVGTSASPGSPTPTGASTATVTATAVAGVLPPPSATPIPMPNGTQLSAGSAGVVWALVGGSRLFRSTDHGSTWEPRGVPPAIGQMEVSFIDADAGWIGVTGSPATQCQQQSFALWHTTDGGATWTPVPVSGVAAAQCKDYLSFVDRVHGYLVTSDPNHSPLVYRTSDGGRNWTASAPLPDPPGFTTQPGGFTIRPGAVQAAGVTLLLPTQAGSTAWVYRSADAGATWQPAASAPPGEGALGILSATHWIDLRPPSGSRETLDGGSTWQPFATDYQQAAPIAPVVTFGDASVGYATVRGEIARTLDGGVHWSWITTPGT